MRRFKTLPVDEALIDELLDLACLAPSVGNSQPWRFVRIDDPARRQAVVANFRACNQEALADYSGSRAQLYASLKLAGLIEAPVHLGVFVDAGTEQGHGLGRKTMAETLQYSAVAAVHGFWLAARAYGIGVGWVSILDAPEIRRLLDLPDAWSLIAYLCVGYPDEEHADPELERHGWQVRERLCRQVTRR